MNILSSISNPPSSSAWARLGSAAFRRRRLVVGVWLAVLVTVFAGVVAIGPSPDSSLDIPASESQRGFETLDEYFGGLGAIQGGSVVFAADQGVDDPAVEAAISSMLSQAASIEGVASIVSPYSQQGRRQGLVSDDGRYGIAQITLTPEVDEFESGDIGAELMELRPQLDGLQVEIGGTALAALEPPESELVGLAFAVFILTIAFGSVLAMGLPIGVAVAGVGIGAGITALLTNLTTIPDFATTIGAMIGLGVGIDYALFIVTRYREATRAGSTPLEATSLAIDTAGRAVVFAGTTVVISLLGMFVMGLGFINGLAIGASVTVVTTMAASVTLLPALIGFAQHRTEVTRWRGLIAAGFVAIALLGLGLGIQPLLLGAPIAAVVLVASFAVAPLRREVPARDPKPLRETWSYRWSRFVQKYPWQVAVGMTVLLLAMAIPVLSMRLGFADESNFEEGTTTREAYELVSEGFGAGTNGPLLLVAEISGPEDLRTAQRLASTLQTAAGVAEVRGPIPNDPLDPGASEAFIIQVIPDTGPQDVATADLVDALRSQVIPSVIEGTDLEVDVAGSVATGIDFSEYLGERMVWFFAAVLGLSFLLLMMVFRSVLVPLKAVIMNMLSIGGAYGVVVAVFQWGWGAGLFNTSAGPIEPFIPMMMFAIVFGLSMDYEVFLLSRVKEEYDRTGDPVNSVADGLAATARVITAAAAIMVVVFGSFFLEDNRIVKMLGLGLASAVLLDATLVRMLLVPATMELLGAGNWWLPRWLDRILPTISVEGSHPADESDDEPTPELISA